MFYLSELEKLVNLQKIYRQQGKQYSFKRFLFPILKKEAKKPHITGISGLRGSGKTVLLLQLLNELPNSFYISLDTLTSDLFQITLELTKRFNINYLILDEVHYLPNWSFLLKQIYDVLNIKIFFTSSVSLDILKAKEDLSRRVLILSLPILSFREFLAIHADLNLAEINLQDIFSNRHTKANPELESLFEDYLRFPLASQIADRSPQLISNIIERIINYDLANIKPLTSKDKQIIKQTLRFLANIEGGDISITMLAKNLGVTKYLMKNYVELLEKAFLVHQIYPEGKNVLKEPKILLNLPFRMYISQQTEISGSLKEDFFVSIMKAIGAKIYYLKTKRGRKTPDFLIKINEKSIVVEIGGKRKGISQFKGIKTDKKFIATYPFLPKPNAIPLYEFGRLF